MHIDPRALDAKDAYKLLIGTVVPRPIAVVSTLSQNGKPNLAPFSYFNIASHDPMALSFSVAGPKIIGGLKDTLANVLARSDGYKTQFVVNVASENYARQVAQSAAPLAHDESEFDLTGLLQAPSLKVKPPRVAEAPIAFECETSQIVAVGGARIVIGEVVHIYLQDGLLDEAFHVNYSQLKAIGRMAGSLFVRTADRFEAKTEDYLPAGFKA